MVRLVLGDLSCSGVASKSMIVGKSSAYKKHQFPTRMINKTAPHYIVVQQRGFSNTRRTSSANPQRDREKET